MPKFIHVKTAPGHSERSIEEHADYYVNVDLIIFVSQASQNPDQSSLRLVGYDHLIHITESAENFFSRIGRE